MKTVVITGWPALLLLLACGTTRPATAEEGPPIKFFDDLVRFSAADGERSPFEEPIETDRHDFTQSARTVGRGVVQLEGGYSYFYKDNDEEIEQAHTLPELLMRWGVTEDIEFRLRWNHVWEFADVREDLRDSEDLRWAFKLGVTEPCGWIPESALELRSTAPTGGRAWTTGRVDFGVDYIYSWDLAERWTLSGSTGFFTNGGGEFGVQPEPGVHDDFVLWSQSVALGVPMGECTSVYLEYFGLFTQDRADNLSEHYFDLGVDFLITNNVVFDLRVGKGLSDDADDLFAGIGGGVRF